MSNLILFDSVSLKSEKQEKEPNLSQTENFCRYDGKKYEKGEKITISDGTQMICNNPPNWDIL